MHQSTISKDCSRYHVGVLIARHRKKGLMNVSLETRPTLRVNSLIVCSITNHGRCSVDFRLRELGRGKQLISWALLVAENQSECSIRRKHFCFRQTIHRDLGAEMEIERWRETIKLKLNNPSERLKFHLGNSIAAPTLPVDRVIVSGCHIRVN